MRKYIDKTFWVVIFFVLICVFVHGYNSLEIIESQPDENLTVSENAELKEITQLPQITPEAQTQEKSVEEIKQKNTNQLIREQENTSSDTVDFGQTQKAEVLNSKLICTISVRCDTILSNLDKLKGEVYEQLPEKGIIYYAENVEFIEGESAFDLLLREMRRNNIHMEFEYTPAFDSVYIEGIGNIYEFDCGAKSGWLYLVNGKLANCGCSQYILSPGDKVEWVYTCDFGADVS